MEIDTRGLKATVGWDLNKLGRQSNDYQVCGLNNIVRFRIAIIGLRHTLAFCVVSLSGCFYVPGISMFAS